MLADEDLSFGWRGSGLRDGGAGAVVLACAERARGWCGWRGAGVDADDGAQVAAAVREEGWRGWPIMTGAWWRSCADGEERDQLTVGAAGQDRPGAALRAKIGGLRGRDVNKQARRSCGSMMTVSKWRGVAHRGWTA